MMTPGEDTYPDEIAELLSALVEMLDNPSEENRTIVSRLRLALAAPLGQDLREDESGLTSGMIRDYKKRMMEERYKRPSGIWDPDKLVESGLTEYSTSYVTSSTALKGSLQPQVADAMREIYSQKILDSLTTDTSFFKKFKPDSGA